MVASVSVRCSVSTSGSDLPSMATMRSPGRSPARWAGLPGKARVDDPARTVRFWEMLVEKGSGMSSGMDDVGPGIGFSAGTYKTGGKERSGSIEEASNFFDKDFDYQWDYAAVRTALQQVASAAGYGWEMVLNPKSV